MALCQVTNQQPQSFLMVEMWTGNTKWLEHKTSKARSPRCDPWLIFFFNHYIKDGDEGKVQARAVMKYNQRKPCLSHRRPGM